MWDNPPSGYGLEAMDLCESLFVYWPCLSRENIGDAVMVKNVLVKEEATLQDSILCS